MGKKTPNKQILLLLITSVNRDRMLFGFFSLMKMFIMHRKSNSHLNYFFHMLSFMSGMNPAFDLEQDKVQENQISVLYTSGYMTNRNLGARM